MKVCVCFSLQFLRFPLILLGLSNPLLSYLSRFNTHMTFTIWNIFFSIVNLILSYKQTIFFSCVSTKALPSDEKLHLKLVLLIAWRQILKVIILYA